MGYLTPFPVTILKIQLLDFSYSWYYKVKDEWMDFLIARLNTEVAGDIHMPGLARLEI